MSSVPPGLTHVQSGKVRELYETGDGRLLLVATDRVSAFDHVLPTPIPDRGRILTQLSVWWFRQVADLIANHIVSTDVPPGFADRAVLCRRLDMVPIECVARGYLAGSGLADYAATGAVCGVSLPPGLKEGSRLPEPIFTPATKAPHGEHDENVSYDRVAATVGAESASELRRITLALYTRAHEIARERGMILADTKFEFGRDAGGRLVLADEALTPDSSRFWMAEEWQPGSRQNPFDKQYIRDWLASPESGWNRDAGQYPPPLPEHVVRRTRERYIEAYERLTGTPSPPLAPSGT